MNAKQWPRRTHNAPKPEEEKDVATEVEADRRTAKEAAGGISRGGEEQDDSGHSRSRKITFTLPKRSKMKLEMFFWELGEKFSEFDGTIINLWSTVKLGADVWDMEKQHQHLRENVIKQQKQLKEQNLQLDKVLENLDET